MVHFLNAFCYGNEAFPKGSSYNETVSLLVVFHLPYSKYKVVKICFYLCQNQNFSLVSPSCRSCSTRGVCVALVSSFVSQSCRSGTRVVIRLDQLMTSLLILTIFGKNIK